ncbi:MAG: DHHW family protein [Eubacteriales bacterium]|nr:DHHW family protein [Eubacteriales bacterium]MDD4323311.1 DHHW family protein [Eubacteriales bacterium]MDD4540578.1 DHHW family protein [Eubacteriales bacterium]
MKTDNHKNIRPSRISGIRSPQLRSSQNESKHSGKSQENREYTNPWLEEIIMPPEPRSKVKKRRNSSGRPAAEVYQNKTTHLNSVIIYASFLAALILVGIMTLLIPDKEISARENRALAQFPKIDSESIFSGETSGDLDSWYSDQFPGRDGLVSLWKKVDGALSLRLTEDDITIVEGNSDMGQGALDPKDPEDQGNPLYTSPFFGGGGENPNP